MRTGDGAEVFESLGRFEEGIVAAQRDLICNPVSPFTRIQSQLAIGRCHAKLGRAQPAEEAFQAAIAEAKRCELPFLEMLAHRDLVVHVLDAAGRREEQLAALGGAISRMVLPAGEYTPLLGSGLDAEAAVAAAASSA
jgi:tetratricopeptide (TPR) repeat protein